VYEKNHPSPFGAAFKEAYDHKKKNVALKGLKQNKQH
jgi:hypothetical protein